MRTRCRSGILLHDSTCVHVLCQGRQAGRDFGPHSGLAFGDVRPGLRPVAPEIPPLFMRRPARAPWPLPLSVCLDVFGGDAEGFGNP